MTEYFHTNNNRKSSIKSRSVFPQNTYRRRETTLKYVRDQTPADLDVGISDEIATMNKSKSS